MKNSYFFLMLPALILFIASCSKSSTSPGNANFAGTYNGNILISGISTADTITIPASSTSTIVMNSRTATGSNYSISATVSGTTLTILTSPPQTITTGLGSYTATGNGTLINSDSLVINYSFSGHTGTFRGGKK